MNKMEQMTQKEANVIKFIIRGFLMLLVLMLNSCDETTKDELVVLDSFLKDFKTENKIDTVYLEKSNSNELVLDRYNEFKKSKKLKDSLIINHIFSENELENYRKQTLSLGNWNYENISIDNILFKEKGKRVHISKPIFTKNRNYALIYSFRKGKNEAHFMPSIFVYKKNKSNFIKVSEIPIKSFN